MMGIHADRIRSVGIFYFSGTGNTEMVADLLKKEFIQQELQVDLIRMEDGLKNGLDMNIGYYDIIGLGSQIIGYGVPKIVHDFIRLLPKVDGKDVFIFRTAGGVAPVNYNASKPMIKWLGKKGYQVYYERIFSISSNWIAKFDDEVTRQLYKATKEKIGLMCGELLRGERRIYITGLGLRLKMGSIRTIASPIFQIIGKDYGVSKTCVRCGLCVKTCPSGNIRMKKGTIKFGFNCNSCMRCLYICPQKSIHFRLFKFFRVPGEYNVKKILEQPGNGAPCIEGRIPPFFHKYVHEKEM
ncbi:EFR1 family ferrodoxin [Gorillibacterium massiliense]|uniref:EFR1 family ferrodoxin n=1 Tax=Gorillibacterium massiliense TaxID=1280390 RepID=UPI0004BB84B0|nr:EFR1 family ferrodoxin [Gorillibacterium massiliense]